MGSKCTGLFWVQWPWTPPTLFPWLCIQEVASASQGFQFLMALGGMTWQHLPHTHSMKLPPPLRGSPIGLKCKCPGKLTLGYWRQWINVAPFVLSRAPSLNAPFRDVKALFIWPLRGLLEWPGNQPIAKLWPSWVYTFLNVFFFPSLPPIPSPFYFPGIILTHSMLAHELLLQAIF